MTYLRTLLCACIAIGCGSSRRPKRCQADSDCSANQGCNLIDPSDGYCSPLCRVDSDCPHVLSCPTMSPVEGGDCRGKGLHGSDRGVCELYEHQLGPNDCAEQPVPDAQN